jgi:hypothetical protein
VRAIIHGLTAGRHSAASFIVIEAALIAMLASSYGPHAPSERRIPARYLPFVGGDYGIPSYVAC